jgi:uncharacterized protein (TIGR04255 family)
MSKADFTRSPLTEVVCGVEFNAPGFSSVHFGLYWESIRSQFPNPPLDRPPIAPVELLAVLPRLRRVWFESEDKHQLIQLQEDRFHYNWRLQNSSRSYPHFQEVYQGFKQQWESFNDWWLKINDNGFPIERVRYELTYLNQLDRLVKSK